MTTPERYTNTCGSGLCMDRAPDGEWVNYDEYLTLRAERDALAGDAARMDFVEACGLHLSFAGECGTVSTIAPSREKIDAAIAAANGDAQ